MSEFQLFKNRIHFNYICNIIEAVFTGDLFKKYRKKILVEYQPKTMERSQVYGIQKGTRLTPLLKKEGRKEGGREERREGRMEEKEKKKSIFSFNFGKYQANNINLTIRNNFTNLAT